MTDKLSKAIAGDIKQAHEEALELQRSITPENGDHGFEDIDFKDDLADALENVLSAYEEGASNGPIYSIEELEPAESENEESGAKPPISDYDVYMEVYKYVIGMAGYLLNQEALLQSYPVLHQHRMFLHGAVLEYRPDNSQSSVSESYFNFWSTFDCRIGDTGETLGTIVRETVIQLEQADANTMHFLDIAMNSRMGLFLHCGNDESGLILEELGFDRQLFASTPWEEDYQGREGEIWLVRLLPPLGDSDCHVMITTPYILQADCLDSCRSLIQKPKDLHDFLKYGPTPQYWVDYLNKVPSIVDTDRGVIFLKHPPEKEEE